MNSDSDQEEIWEKKPHEYENVYNENDNENGNENENDEDENENKKNEEINEYKLFQILKEKKELIAQMSSIITEDPEKSVELLNQIFKYCKDKFYSIRKYAIISLVAIYIDIIPGYTIRELSEQEKNQKLSKEVFQLRKFEEKLLQNYHKFIQYLIDILKQEQKRINRKKRKKDYFSNEETKNNDYKINGEIITSEKEENQLVLISLKSLNSLLKAKPYFNFNNEISKSLVSYIDDSREDISNECFGSIIEVIKHDKSRDISLVIIKEIAKIIKQRNYKSNPKLVQVFLHISIDPDVILKQKKMEEEEEQRNLSEKLKRKLERKKSKMKQRMTQKQKLKKIENDKIEKKLKKTLENQEKERSQRLQIEMLNAIFITYFRVLKRAKHSVLMPFVLEGLSKFSHLINLNFWRYNFNIKRNCEIQEYQFENDYSLHFYSNSNNYKTRKSIISTDFKDFYDKLYSRMFQSFITHLLPISKDNYEYSNSNNCLVRLEGYVPNLSIYNYNKEINLLLVNCIEKLLFGMKELSNERIAGFIKRLASLLLHQYEGVSLGILILMKDLMMQYPKTQQLLDSENLSSGVYDPNIKSPEHSNAFSSNLWEFCLLKNHYNPQISSYVQTVSKYIDDIDSLDSHTKYFLDDKKPNQIINSSTSFNFINSESDFLDFLQLNELPQNFKNKMKHKKVIHYHHQSYISDSPFLRLILEEENKQ
ncbi:nucleolar complex protein [Anaeramoeba ignava]|uniref:Nucleolar complex protein n=1 Tax=Anaeramoeba ignava TaxID=1746090 RepID=A0A9Q0RGP0_ANAIG|nr:nucleolar complex protein [Anaeramoeba ignava]